MIESVQSKIEKKFSEMLRNDDSLERIEITTLSDDHRRFLPLSLSVYGQMVDELTREEKLECIVYDLLNFIGDKNHQPKRIKRRKQYQLDLSDIRMTLQSFFPAKEVLEIEHNIFKE